LFLSFLFFFLSLVSLGGGVQLAAVAPSLAGGCAGAVEAGASPATGAVPGAGWAAGTPDGGGV
jgi:hypothetical protein